MDVCRDVLGSGDEVVDVAVLVERLGRARLAGRLQADHHTLSSNKTTKR